MSWVRRVLVGLGVVVGLAGPGVAWGQGLADYDYEHLRFHGVGLDYGYIQPTRVEPTSSYTLRVDLGYLGPNVRIVPSLTYWSSRMRQRELDRIADRLNVLGAAFDAEDLGSIRWRNFSVNVDGQYVWPVTSYMQAFVGAGASLHLLNGSWPALEGTYLADLMDRVTAGAAALAGVEFAPHPWVRIYSELRYSLLSDVRYPGIRIGAAMAVPSAGATGGPW